MTKRLRSSSSIRAPEIQVLRSSRSLFPRTSLGKFCSDLNYTPKNTLFLLYCFYRFAIIELKYMADSGVHQEKIFFVLYAPDLSKNTGDKFIFATSKEQFKKKVQPFNYEIQINDWEDLKEEDFILKIKK